MLRHLFATKYPNLFVTIYELMKDGKQFKMPVLPAMSKPLDETIIRFFEFVERQVKEWSEMNVDSYLEYEASLASFISFEPDDENVTFRCNPYLCLYTFPDEKADGIKLLHRWLRCEEHLPLKTVAILPVLIADGYEIEPLLPIDIEILEVIQRGVFNIINIIKQIFRFRNTDEVRSSYLIRYIKEEVNRLVKREIIIVTNN